MLGGFHWSDEDEARYKPICERAIENAKEHEASGGEVLKDESGEPVVICGLPVVYSEGT